MYVTKEEIERVRRQHDLVAVVQAHGVELKRKGQNWVGRCPFHDDHTPSLVVNRERQLWNCFGACRNNGSKSGGDVFAFVAKVEGIPFPAALKKLGYEEPAVSPRVAAPQVTTPRVAPPRSSARTRSPGRSELHSSELLGLVSAHAHQVFREQACAQEYLKRRGLTDAAMLTAFQVGYADGTLLRTLGPDIATALKESGVLTARARELMAGCVVFPLTLPDEGVVGFYGRHVKRDQHLYLPGPRRGVFHWQALKGADEVIFTESVFDALTLYQAGFRNVSCVYGTQGLTADHEELLLRFRVRRVLLCLDNDAAGSQATAALGARLRQLGLEVADVRVQGAGGAEGAKDPNELFAKLGTEAAREAFTARLAAARGVAARRPAPPANGSDRSSEGASSLTVNGTVKEEKVKGKEAPPSTGPQVEREDGGGWLVTFAVSEHSVRTWRVRGLTATGLDRLRVNLRIAQDQAVHLDTLDLYSHRARVALVRELADLFRCEEEELAKEIAALIDMLESLRLKLAKAHGDAKPARVTMPDSEREAALRLLQGPRLVERIVADFTQMGCVGERTALTVGYLATLSRLLDEPLGLMIVSRSGAGKSRLQDALCAVVPDEDLVRYTRLTGQALFYKEEDSLAHKVLAIDEEEGAAEAAYSIRTLQSAQVLTVAATRADPATGKLKTEEYRVKGPVSILFTTTSPEALDYETRNRFVQVGIDESTEQTRRILVRQRQADTLEGVLGREQATVLERTHQNVQRLLRPLKVVNPFATTLVYPDQRLQMRREQKKYLTLIKTIALLHQHQREVKRARRGGVEVEYVEVEASDIALANELARQVLGRCLDELAHPTRQLLKHLVELTGATDSRLFTRHDVRAATGWTDWQLRVHLRQLVELEYVVVAAGGNGKRMAYELLFDGDPDEDARYLEGLVNVPAAPSACETESMLVRQKATLRVACEPRSQAAKPVRSSL